MAILTPWKREGRAGLTFFVRIFYQFLGLCLWIGSSVLYFRVTLTRYFILPNRYALKDKSSVIICPI